MPPIYFYIPEDMTNLPNAIEEFWAWQIRSTNTSHLWGRYHWVLQTYLYFKKYQIKCELVNEIPKSGILISHRDCFKYDLKPNSKQFFIVLLVDRLTAHPYGNFHILHNPVQTLPFSLSFQYIPPWAQVSLIPRDKTRNLKFENIGFFGYPENLTKELDCTFFRNYLMEQKINISIPQPKYWNDFSDIDAILAIRNFGMLNEHYNKPALKLYNSWAAGVPAILGYESAYRTEGKPGHNYLEAVSLEDTIKLITTLKNDANVRKYIISSGLDQYNSKYNHEVTIERWKSLIFNKIIPSYNVWTTSNLIRKTFFFSGRIRESLLWRFSKK